MIGLPDLRLLPDAPVPDGRTVLTAPDASGVEAMMGHGRHLRPFIPDTNPLERVNREIGRRTDVVGIFPNDAALIRLAGSLLIEQNDEWLVSRRYLSQESLCAAQERGTEPDSRREDEGGARPQRGLRDRPPHRRSGATPRNAT